jgi:hypothetical protein
MAVVPADKTPDTRLAAVGLALYNSNVFFMSAVEAPDNLLDIAADMGILPAAVEMVLEAVVVGVVTVVVVCLVIFALTRGVVVNVVCLGSVCDNGSVDGNGGGGSIIGRAALPSALVDGGTTAPSATGTLTVLRGGKLPARLEPGNVLLILVVVVVVDMLLFKK